jgi:hypothetical protein
MDVERIIDDIEQLQEMFEAPDIRPLSVSDISAANRRHDEMLAHSPWFQLWQRYGVCCRTEPPVLRLGESDMPITNHQFLRLLLHLRKILLALIHDLRIGDLVAKINTH